MAEKYYSSGELMEAVRALDYKKKYEVLKAFNRLMAGEDSMMCERFKKFFEIATQIGKLL